MKMNPWLKMFNKQLAEGIFPNVSQIEIVSPGNYQLMKIFIDKNKLPENWTTEIQRLIDNFDFDGVRKMCNTVEPRDRYYLPAIVTLNNGHKQVVGVMQLAGMMIKAVDEYTKTGVWIDFYSNNLPELRKCAWFDHCNNVFISYNNQAFCPTCQLQRNKQVEHDTNLKKGTIDVPEWKRKLAAEIEDYTLVSFAEFFKGSPDRDNEILSFSGIERQRYLDTMRNTVIELRKINYGPIYEARWNDKTINGKIGYDFYNADTLKKIRTNKKYHNKIEIYGKKKYDSIQVNGKIHTFKSSGVRDHIIIVIEKLSKPVPLGSDSDYLYGDESDTKSKEEQESESLP